jgi:hypothetical protein
MVSDFASSTASVKFVAAVDVLIDTKAIAYRIDLLCSSSHTQHNPILLHRANSSNSFTCTIASTRVIMTHADIHYAFHVTRLIKDCFYVNCSPLSSRTTCCRGCALS